MAKNINSLSWDNKANVYDFPTENAFADGTSTDFLAGNDRVSATGTTEIGIEIRLADVFAGKGNDTLSGTSRDEDGLYIWDTASVSGGDGNDLIRGQSRFGYGFQLEEASTLDGGSGNDTIAGISTEGQRGFEVDNSTLLAGAGNDSVYGSASWSGDGTSHGLLIDGVSLVDLGTGNDTLEGYASNADTGDADVYADGVSVYSDSSLLGGNGNDHLNGYAYADASGGFAGSYAFDIQASQVDLGAGNDCLYGEAVSTSGSTLDDSYDAEAYGLFLGNFDSNSDAGTILGGAGNDTLAFNAFATGEDSYAAGAGIYGESQVILGDGADCVAGFGSVSNPYSTFGYGDALGVDIEDQCFLSLGNGNDTVFGEAVSSNNASEESISYATGIYVAYDSSLDGGAGTDRIIGTADAAGDDFAVGTGIWIGNTEGDLSELFTGTGNDFVSGTGIVSFAGNFGEATGIYNDAVLDTGAGNDQVVGYGYDDTTDGSGSNVDAYGIWNDEQGEIYLGDGNDKLTGVGDGYGIWNDGFISTGAGKDTVDVSDSAFGFYTNFLDDFGASVIDLGSGNDTVKGFGYANLDGGDGVDTLRLAEGTYDWDGFGEIIGLSGAGADTDLYLENFERIGAYGGGTLNLANLTDSGTFTVTANRITFA